MKSGTQRYKFRMADSVANVSRVVFSLFYEMV
jgi:hypothetical protein